MKFTSTLICLFLILCFAPATYSQINIWDQEDFEDEIAEGFTEQAGDPDYIIHANALNDYTIDADEILEIDEGVIIELDDGVEIIVEGRITTGAAGANPVVFQRIAEGLVGQGDNWEAITIVGDNDGGLEDDQGIVTLNHAEFRGGGEADVGLPVGVPVWQGMIRLTGNTPVLVLGTDLGPEESNLSASETNGIVVHGEVEDFVLTLYNVDMDDVLDPIEDIGIKINDYRPDPENNNDPWEIDDGDMLIDADCDIQWCGAHGLASYLFEGVDYDILNSVFSDNGTGNPNPGEVNGAGLYFWEFREYGLDYTIDIENTLAERNSWDGMRFKDMTGLVHIIDCVIQDNSERGIYYDFTGDARLAFIEECTITANDWDGIFVQKGTGDEAGIKIRHNEIRNNAVDTDDYMVAWPEREFHIANLRLHGHIGDADVWFAADDFTPHTEIWNNILEGAHNGITIEGLYGNATAPEFINCRNNVQFDATYHGLWVRDLGVNENAPDPEPRFYNNVFCNNGDHVAAEPDGDSEVGIRFGPEPGAGGLPELDDNVFHSNIVVGNDDIGIQYEEDNNPDFPNNGYFQNGVNRTGCRDTDPVVGNPDFVNQGAGDYHLLWSSPMINEGFGLNDDDGSPNDIGAFGGPWAVDFIFNNWEDYCAIPIGSELTNDDEGLLYDTYWMFGDATVEAGETLTIEAGATVYMAENSDLFVDEAQLIIDGDPGLEVLFRLHGDLVPGTPLQANPHDGIVIDGGIVDNDHSIEYFEIWGSDAYGIEIIGNAEVAAESFNHVNIHNCRSGLRVLGSVPDIEICTFNNFTTYAVYLAGPDAAVTIDNCTISNAQYGIRTYMSTPATTIVDCDISDIDRYCIYLYRPVGAVTITNTDMIRAEIGIYATTLSGAGAVTPVIVTECTMTDMEWYGIRAKNRIKLDVTYDDQEADQTIITNADYIGISLSGNSEAGADRSSIDGCEITDCSVSGGNLAEGGIYIYDANPHIDGTFIYKNNENGIYLSSDGEPTIVGSEDNANNIINNGIYGSQTSSMGAEIRVASSSAMDENQWIFNNNIYDCRDAGANYERDGYIMSKTSGATDIKVDGNYFGYDLEDDLDYADDGDFYSSGGADFDVVLGQAYNAGEEEGVYETARVVDRWDDVDGANDDPDPANAFQAGLAAMKQEEFGRAVEAFWEWIAEEPASPQAATAARIILRAERARGGDLNRLRETFLDLAERSEEDYPALWWKSRKLAIKCLIYQDEYEDGIAEYRRLQRIAPDEVERLFVEMDILFAEETVDLMHTDDSRSIQQRLMETSGKIENLLIEKEERQTQPLLPSEFELTTVYPNPFNNTVQIHYTVPEAAKIKLSIFDMSGREVEVLFSGGQDAGAHQTLWNSQGAATGSYLLRLESSGVLRTQKLILIK